MLSQIDSSDMIQDKIRMSTVWTCMKNDDPHEYKFFSMINHIDPSSTNDQQY